VTGPTRPFSALAGVPVRVKVVDIGANPIDSEPPYAGLLQRGEAQVVGFEPNPAALAVLNEKKSAAEQYFPHAVGDGGRHRLHICQAPGMTSLLEPDMAVLNLFHGFPDWGKVLATETLDTVRLDDVPETAGVQLLKLDIQGAELMVLQHAEARLKTALVIQAEVEFLPLYRGQPLFSDVEQFLRARGFVFHRFFPQVSRTIRPMLVDQNIYAGLSQLVWADGIFVRDFTRPEGLADSQILPLAAILHDCYQSIDLVLHLLNEHDRRHGSSVATTYFTALQEGAPR
jgi:FkbM family methyltransferase